MSTDNASPGASTAPPNVGSSAPASVAVACGAAQSQLDAVSNGLDGVLLDLPPKDAPHHRGVGASGLQVIERVSAMLRTTPTLSGSVTADDMDAAVADANACTTFAANLDILRTKVLNTGRLRLESASQMSTSVLAVARKEAPRDTVVAKAVADINAITARGNKADTAEKVAVTKQQRATKATARATKATTEAEAATVRANALQHGTGDATITQPALSAPAPSVSLADAPTAAPPTVPGTSGTGTIR